MPLHTRVRHWSSSVAALLCIAGLASGCGGDSATEPASVAGAYTATVLQVTPLAGSPIDVLAAGGTLSLTIAADNTTTGTLFLPASIAGGSDVTMNLAGTAIVNGSSVHFQQTTDSFVRDLTFTVNGTSLEARNQPAGGATFTVVLTRQ